MTDVSNGNQYACKIIPKNRMQKIHMQKVRILNFFQLFSFYNNILQIIQYFWSKYFPH